MNEVRPISMEEAMEYDEKPVEFFEGLPMVNFGYYRDRGLKGVLRFGFPEKAAFAVGLCLKADSGRIAYKLILEAERTFLSYGIFWYVIPIGPRDGKWKAQLEKRGGRMYHEKGEWALYLIVIDPARHFVQRVAA